jgi:hypothetical protein
MSIKEDSLEKGQIEREHLERISKQNAAEEEALRNSRVVKGADLTVYKNRKYKKYVAPKEPKKEVPDEQKLATTRSYQFLIGFMGIIGTALTFVSIYTGQLVYSLSITKDFGIEIEVVLLGCAMALAGIIGLIGFQHRHDTISDRIAARRRWED